MRRWLAPVAILSALIGVSAAAQFDTADLDRRAMARIEHPPLGLPRVPLPHGNPPTIQKVRLGRKLFLDRRLSDNGTLSCAMCHVPEQGFTVNEIQTAVGKGGKSLRRNAATLLNVGYGQLFFSDGSEPTLDLQPLDVFLNPDEMGAPSAGALVSRVQSLLDYASLFEEAFREPASIENIGKALGTYMRTLLSANSPFDRWHFNDEEGALSEAAKRGFRLFVGEAHCVNCHSVGAGHALFTDHGFHDTGRGWHTSMVGRTLAEPVRVELAPDLFTTVDRSILEAVGDPLPADLGRYEVTHEPADRWRFKTPTLRNVTLTAPYMHDGSLPNLREVVEFYSAGGFAHDGLDPLITPLGLSEQEIDDLVSFLRSLTGDNVDALIRDARSERIGNPGDPSP